MLRDELQAKHSSDGPERCGVILSSGEVVEIKNIHYDPMNSFAMPESELLKPEVVATWHTHPITGPNLSVADYKAFLFWPKLKHYIVAASGIWCYEMHDDILVSYENPFT